MWQIKRLVYILLYVQFFVHDAFASNNDALLKENKNDADDAAWINEWRCNSDDECTATNSRCNDHLCRCAPGYIFSADMSSCLKVATELHDSCEETVQCSAYLLSGAKCINKVCVCGPGYYYLHGRCNRHVGLFEKCERNIDCYVNADFEASTCDTADRICRCSPGFYQREYRTCRREGRAVGEECTIDIDCTFNDAYCKEFECALKSESEETAGPPSNILSSVDDSADYESGFRAGSNCTTDEDCKILGNAICDPVGTCRCGRAHFAPDTGAGCIPELGESCRSNDVSYIKKAICRDGKWSCTNGTVVSKDNRECREATRRYNGNCRQDEQCYVFGPDAECKNQKCVCNENSHYVESELFCWGSKRVGETCVQNHDCYVKDFKGKLVCKNDICDCPDGTHLNKNKIACIDNSTGLGGVCEANEDCATPNSVCKKEVCTCATNYYRSNDQCLAGINSTCTSDENCAPKNSVCASNVCSCKSDHVAVAIDSCLPISSYGEPCSLDIQCSAHVPGAVCVAVQKNGENITDTTESFSAKAAANKVCTCGDEDHYRLGKCRKRRLLGETCTNIGECYLNFNPQYAMCMNGKCTCNWGYRGWNGSVCIKTLQTVFLPNGGVTNLVSTRLLSIILFVFSFNIFRLG